MAHQNYAWPPTIGTGNPQAAPIRAAFVMEQTLGHVTHAQNLHAALAAQSAVDPTWLPVPFDVVGAGRWLPVWRSNWSVRASWRARRMLDAALSRAPHDAIFFHTQVASLFSVPAMRRLPAIISLDATPINYDVVGAAYDHRPAGDGPLDRRKYQMNRDAFQAAEALVSWSEWAKQSLIGDYGVDSRRVHVLAPGASPAYFALGQRRHVAASDEPSARPVQVLFVGGDFRRKGGPELLESLSGTLGRRCMAHIVTKEAVPAQENVRVYHGVGPNSPELLRLFAAADVFVLPSRAECLAVVLMEATAAGLPVVTTNVGALGEAVRDGESGVVVPAGDVRALTAALETLTSDSRLRRRMGQAGLALARQKFDAAANNQALLGLLSELASLNSDRRRVA